MPEKVRLEVVVLPETATLLEEWAERENISRAVLMRSILSDSLAKELNKRAIARLKERQEKNG